MEKSNLKNIAIVGCGPRGLRSLEELIYSLSEIRDAPYIEGLIFERNDYPGAGQVWTPVQADTNLLNSSDRDLKSLKGREKIEYNNIVIPKFPSFVDWLEKNHNHNLSRSKDHFLPRKIMGDYLHARFTSIYKVLEKHKVFKLISANVIDIKRELDFISIIDTRGNQYQCKECLLTIGHQPTFDDKEIKEWKNFSSNSNALLFENPYDNDMIDSMSGEKVLALRGLGLAMLDVLRLLTLGKGATFSYDNNQDLRYEPSPRSIRKMIPYSDDGLLLVPKPKSYEVDKYFTVKSSLKEQFESDIQKTLEQSAQPTSLKFLRNAFSKVCTRIYTSHPLIVVENSDSSIQNIIELWLADTSIKHELILDTHLPPEEYIEATIAMANGDIAPSIDYCVGQVWRHLQPTMYNLFSHCKLNGKMMEEVIALDESTKRYSFGPPIESMKQLLALSRAGVVELKFANDPQVICINDHWRLKADNHQIDADVMINTVLDEPVLEHISSDLIVGLKERNLVQSVTENLGIRTSVNGLISSSVDSDQLPIGVLGRNSIGSVMGVDAILQCFGPRIRDWAIGCRNRILESNRAT